MINCERCGAETSFHTMSQFNTDTLCMKCIDKEKAHPLYPAAVKAELDEVRRGNYNYLGIGKPSDL